MIPIITTLRAGGGMESVCKSEDISFTSPLPPIAGQVMMMLMMRAMVMVMMRAVSMVMMRVVSRVMMRVMVMVMVRVMVMVMMRMVVMRRMMMMVSFTAPRPPIAGQDLVCHQDNDTDVTFR